MLLAANGRHAALDPAVLPVPVPYDAVGPAYDQTRRAEPKLVAKFIEHLGPQPGGAFLDVACGTGNYTVALSRAGLDMTGVDPSARMLQVARSKSSRFELRQACAEGLPFWDGQFKGVLCCNGVHHFSDMEQAFAEIFRVIAQGRLVLFTADPSQIETFWLNEYFPTIMRQGNRRIPPVPVLARALRDAGFSRVSVEPWDIPSDMCDYFLYGGKHQPSLYLSEQIRAGITRFRDIDNEEEVRRGCERLRSDIASGRIDDVMRRYQSIGGDYLFVVAEKTPALSSSNGQRPRPA